MKLKDKKIIVAVTGGIAAYKTASLVRLLIKQGAEVQVLMTKLAKEFITPLTLATLSKRPILVEFFNPENGNWNSHVDLGLWADLFIVAPATANTMGKMANGIADNLVVTSYLSARCPVFIVPAMDLDMYSHPSTQKNIKTLQSYGNHIIEATEGELASGLIGKGRMAEPQTILEHTIRFFEKQKSLENKKFLLTAGATIEPIDPVRFISNYSTGKMGYAIAEELAERGAEVVLVSGAVTVSTLNPKITVVKVTSANEMLQACEKYFPATNGAILAAAVADYTVENVSETKMKRTENEMVLKLKPTTDIAAALGKMKTEQQILVGFALETNNEMENAIGKLKRKNLDFIVLNSLNDQGAGFATDTNKISIIDKNNKITNFELKPKNKVALDIVDYMEVFNSNFH